MTHKEYPTREVVEAADEFPDPLIDEIDFKDFDPTGEEIDMEAYFGVDHLDTGEKRLMFAVAEEAIHTFIATANSSNFFTRKVFDDVKNWFASPDALWTFSFLNICRVLGMDEANLLDKLNQWRKVNAPRSFVPVGLPKRKRQKKVC